MRRRSRLSGRSLGAHVIVMDRSQYEDERNWRGSFYELSVELGPVGGDALASSASATLWQHPSIRGPWRRRADYSLKPVEASGDLEEMLFGSVLLPNGIELGCVVYFIRGDADADWLDLSIPMGMLELAFQVRYPLASSTNPWLSDLDLHLAEIGRAVYKRAAFRLGLLGEEVGAFTTAARLTAKDCETGGFLVPEPLWRRLRPSREAVRWPEGLVYAPLEGPHIAFGA